jgi:hypothetical protein
VITVGEGRQWSPLAKRASDARGLLPDTGKGRIMLPDVVQRVSFFIVLQLIDQDLERQCKAAGCPHCHGRLDRAPYERKASGRPAGLPDEVCVRLSLCCSREGCRRRTLPPSCLFLGRRMSFACIILVLVTLRQQRPEGSSAAKLCRQFGISRSTLQRWMLYFREQFPASPWWQRLRGQVRADIATGRLPAALLVVFIETHAGDEQAGLEACLRFLASGWSPGAEHAR